MGNKIHPDLTEQQNKIYNGLRMVGIKALSGATPEEAFELYNEKRTVVHKKHLPTKFPKVGKVGSDDWLDNFLPAYNKFFFGKPEGKDK